MREETEWQELVDAGINQIVGVEKEKIIKAVEWAKKECTFQTNIYGDGNAGEKIVDCLLSYHQTMRSNAVRHKEMM